MFLCNSVNTQGTSGRRYNQIVPVAIRAVTKGSLLLSIFLIVNV